MIRNRLAILAAALAIALAACLSTPRDGAPRAFAQPVPRLPDFPTLARLPVFDVRKYGAAGNGTANDRAALNSANTAASAAGGTLAFAPGTYRVSSALAFASNVQCRFEAGAKLSIDAGITVTFNGTVDAPQTQIFTGSGSAAFGFRTEKLSPLWWGADPTGVADSAAAIRAALAARAGGDVALPGGLFTVGSSLSMTSYTRLVGAGGQPFSTGTWNTTLQAAAGYNGDILVGDQIAVDGGYWNHGSVVENICFSGRTGQTAGSGIRICLGEDAEIRNCSFLYFPDAGIRLQRGHAPGRLKNITVYRNKWGIWFDGGAPYNYCSGTVVIDGLSGDDNDQLIHIAHATADPNASGVLLNVIVTGVKAETSAVVPPGAFTTDPHNPLIGFDNANESQVTLIGGLVQAAQTATTRNVVKINQNGASNAYSGVVNFVGTDIHNYHNLWVDDVKSESYPWFPTTDFPTFRKPAFLSNRGLSVFPSNFSDAARAFRLRGVNPVLQLEHTTTGGIAKILPGTGNPEGVVAAAQGSVFLRLDGTGGPWQTLYVKEYGTTTSTGWVPAGVGRASVDRGDTSPTIAVGVDNEVQRFATALTANRTVTLSPTGGFNGAKFKIVRSGLGAFTLDVGGLKTIPASTAAAVEVTFNGSNWFLSGYEPL